MEPIRALNATLHRDERGVLLISIGAEPASTGGAIDIPALAYLQFAGRVEDAISEVLTNSAARADR